MSVRTVPLRRSAGVVAEDSFGKLCPPFVRKRTVQEAEIAVLPALVREQFSPVRRKTSDVYALYGKALSVLVPILDLAPAAVRAAPSERLPGNAVVQMHERLSAEGKHKRPRFFL